MSRQVIVFFISLILLTACGEPPNKETKQKTVSKASQQSVQNDCQLTMGWDPWEPYLYLTPGNNVSGLDIELIEAMAEEASCSLKFVQHDWMTLLEMIRKGEVDLVAGASITEKRKEFAMFSDPYRSENFVLYVRTGEVDKFDADINKIITAGHKVGVTTDYIYGEKVANLQDSNDYSDQFVYSTVGEANYYNLLQHNVDVIIEDPFVGAYNLKRKGMEDQIEQLELTIHSGNVHLMFSMKSVDHKIVSRFNEAISSIKNSGKYKEILDKYLL
ncbi:substrate-binding periplasmic protein [Pleionea sediminis]|uniref:substrate-binding periplasmic protein n=1 Tax=Pleionea sediminis TaxID=2569479 RepID=UPI001184D8E4|nr:transporter substrate-binding domain-containing protein [Pleionea sediminis]